LFQYIISRKKLGEQVYTPLRLTKIASEVFLLKKTWTDRAGDFIAGKGFYIVLFLCVAAIGISGYYLFSTLGSGSGEVAASAPTQVVVTPSPEVTAPAVPSTPTPSPSPAPSSVPKPSPSPAPSPSTQPSPSVSTLSSPVFTWPVKGEILNDFSLEVLAYDQTMGDWRTHCGVDIAAEAGTEVCAMSSGTVEAIYQDDLMGTTVVIDHGSTLKSLYSNLAAVPTVSVGDEVAIHAVIGSVGRTALAEQGLADHLHLEMSKDGLAIDPMQYLPQ